jgi:hypothetical protein
LSGTIFDFYLCACRRPFVPEPERGLAGDVIEGDDGNRARFWIEPETNRIHYCATSCATLLAICEHIAAIRGDVTEVELLALHPEIAPSKRSSVTLAVKAYRSASIRVHARPFAAKQG